MAALARALAPQLVAQALLIAALLAWPGLTHWARERVGERRRAPALSNEEVERLMDDGVAQPAREPTPRRRQRAAHRAPELQ